MAGVMAATFVVSILSLPRGRVELTEASAEERAPEVAA
jgi:hypothetical protein